MSTKQTNKLSQSFFMLLATIALLVALSLTNTQVNFLGYKTKKIAPLSDIQLKGVAKKVPLPQPVINDSILRWANVPFLIKEQNTSGIIYFAADTSDGGLTHFFEALKATEQKKHKTRIAYFGDSMIEGDLITQDLRNYMQEIFGGNGVGFVPITSIVAGFRSTINHSFSKWNTYNLLGKMPPQQYLGISGYSFQPDTVGYIDTTDQLAGSWVKYKTTNKKHLDRFQEMRLLYGKSKSNNEVIINGRRYKLNGTEKVNQLHLDACRDSASVMAQFQCTSPVDIYGFSFESNAGVFVDNFSFRGNSGLPIIKVNKDIYTGTQKCLQYDLIILGYGLNALSPEMTNYAWYEKGMDNVIKYIKQCFPNTSILLVSVGDKSYKKDGTFQTAPGVPAMVETQKRLAQRNNIAFWSLYDAMGGSGSMVKWVEGDTVLANKDYTHFNFKGAHKIGKLLFDELMKGYKGYTTKPLM